MTRLVIEPDVAIVEFDDGRRLILTRARSDPPEKTAAMVRSLLRIDAVVVRRGFEQIPVPGRMASTSLA